jgi:hypothetical protein
MRRVSGSMKPSFGFGGVGLFEAGGGVEAEWRESLG